MSELEQSLMCSLSMPSTTHTYSIITEFIRKWFLSRFSDNYFKTVHIEGKHVFDDFRKFDMTDILKKSKPMVAIVPRINLGFNRDMLDTNQFGINMLIKTGRLNRAIIRDFERNIFIGTSLELLDIKYTFNIKVESRAQQIDLYKYICMAFSIGHNSEENIDLDYHLPYGMMLQLASDAGYEIENNTVKDIVGFVNYMNRISRLPIIFKYRTINGRMEFFIRFTDIDVIIDNTSELSHDDGVIRGMLSKNYGIEMEITVRVPSPKFFMYYSSNKHELITNIDTIDPNNTTATIYPIYTLELETVPKINEKGWNQYLTTEYYEENIEEQIVIDFSGLFEEGTNIKRVIDLNNEAGISPDNFIDFKVYNGGESLLSYTMNWDNITMTIDNLVKSKTSFIAIYIDTEYVNDKIKELDNMNRDRLK